MHRRAIATSPTRPALFLQPEIAADARVFAETDGVITVWSRFVDPVVQAGYTFEPGQFNMLYVPGYGEAAISICSQPRPLDGLLGHTVRIVGNVTRGLARLTPGETLGIRGPFRHCQLGPYFICKDGTVFATIRRFLQVEEY
jgi:hypothetical protein